MAMVGLKEASERTGVSRYTLWRLVQAGQLSAMRAGTSGKGKWLLDFDYLKRTLKRQTLKNRQQPKKAQ